MIAHLKEAAMAALKAPYSVQLRLTVCGVEVLGRLAYGGHVIEHTKTVSWPDLERASMNPLRLAIREVVDHLRAFDR